MEFTHVVEIMINFCENGHLPVSRIQCPGKKRFEEQRKGAGAARCPSVVQTVRPLRHTKWNGTFASRGWRGACCSRSVDRHARCLENHVYCFQQCNPKKRKSKWLFAQAFPLSSLVFTEQQRICVENWPDVQKVRGDPKHQTIRRPCKANRIVDDKSKPFRPMKIAGKFVAR